MRPFNSNSPIIIIGMHRSGTTMLSKILEALGVLMGVRKDYNNEALFFQNLNKWIFQSTNASWDNPQAFLPLLDDQKLKEKYIEYLQIILNSPRLISYLGIKNYFRYHNLKNLNYSWGWKDPRNTFTLPIWIDVFGGARIIHIYRHGVDVANSLVIRNIKRRERSFERFIKLKKYPMIYKLHPKKFGFTQSVRCNTLKGAFEIWKEYMMQAEKVLQDLDMPYLNLCYENILQQPEFELRKVLRFCNQEQLDYKIPIIAASFDLGRAYAYRQNMESKQFALENKQILTKYGYREDVNKSKKRRLLC